MTEEQRGKRRTARYAEALLVALIVVSIFDFQGAFDVLKIVFIPMLAYSASLRGIDAHFALKRV